jgi:hypothetical protein
MIYPAMSTAIFYDFMIKECLRTKVQDAFYMCKVFQNASFYILIVYKAYILGQINTL